MKLTELFKETRSNYSCAKFESVELLADKSHWICRIGQKQWDGPADNLDQSMQRAMQCAADQLRDVVTVLIKAKKARLI